MEKVKGQFLINGGGLVVCVFQEEFFLGKSQFLETILLNLYRYVGRRKVNLAAQK